MIVNQWVPAAHRGDAIGDSARRVRDLLRAHGPRVRPLRADDRRRHARRGAAVRRPGARRRRRHDLPLRAAVADDRGVRRAAAAAACCSTTTSRRRTSSRRTTRTSSAWPRSAGSELASLAGRTDLALGDSEYNRRELEALGFAETGVFPIAVDVDRIVDAPRDAGAREVAQRRPDELPVRRPHRAEQEDRGHHPAGRALQALRRRALPVHLRRPVRRRAALLQHAARAHRASSAGCPTGSCSRARCRTRSWPPTTGTSSVYISLSEHEGFCVPLVEAMAADVPVLAYACTRGPGHARGRGRAVRAEGFRTRRRAARACWRSTTACGRGHRGPAPAARAFLGQPRSTPSCGGSWNGSQ